MSKKICQSINVNLLQNEKKKKCRGWNREFYKSKAYMYIVYINY